MDNASNALIIAGTILIALIVLSMGVYLVASYRQVDESYEQTLTTAEIEKFNSHFIQFENRKDITAQEIVTLIKYAKSYEDKTQIHTTINVTNYGSLNTDPSINNGSDTTGLINAGIIDGNPELNPTGTSITYTNYECQSIHYGDNGRIDEITFRKTTEIKNID